MNEEPSLISMHPFFRGFVLSIVQTMRERNFETDDKFVVDADLVPRVSEKVMKASMGAGVIKIRDDAPLKPVRPRPVVKRDMSVLVAPIVRVKTKKVISEVQPKSAVMPPVSVAPIKSVVTPATIVGSAVGEGGEYGKISPLLNDPSVSSIECLGAGKELMILRGGQKQRTRIVLNIEEIREILDRVADEAHIPLLEGVFRASVKNFSINAVISEMIGSRFVIKKAATYD